MLSPGNPPRDQVRFFRDGGQSSGCTLPLFLTLVAASLSNDGTIPSFLTFGAYGVGMGTVVMALAFAAAFAR